MSNQNESGHYKNVANLKALIAYGQEFGSSFNPPGNDLQLAALQTFYDQVKAAYDAQVTAEVNLVNARDTRRTLFVQLKPMALRVLHVMMACNAPDEKIAEARSIVNKVRAVVKPKVTPPDPLPEGEEELRTRSTLQSSYDARIFHFERLVILLSSIPDYIPNEPELSLASLTAYVTTLQTANDAVNAAMATRNSTMILRNQLMYDKHDGLVHRAIMLKKYVASLYGVTSEQYRKTNRLQFKTIK